MQRMTWRIVCACAVFVLVACQVQTPPDATGEADMAAIEQLYQAGRTAYAAGKYTEAAETFGRVVQRVPNHYKALVNWGVALSRGGKPEEAIVKFQQALALDPEHHNNAEVYYNWGVALERLGKHRDAVEKFDQAVALNAALETPELQGYLRRYRPVQPNAPVSIPPAPAPSSR